MAFYTCSRLASQSLLSNLRKLPTSVCSVQYASTAVPKITFKKYEKPELEHHDIKNERLNRPLSPHLTIYAYQFNSVTSIGHRAAGIVLSFYASTLGIGALVLPNDISHYVTMVESLNLSPITIFLAKVCLAAPFGYHFANGIRHLYWDTAKGLTIRELFSTGYAMLGVAAVITLGLASL